jgi:hypothetical protein
MYRKGIACQSPLLQAFGLSARPRHPPPDDGTLYPGNDSRLCWRCAALMSRIHPAPFHPVTVTMGSTAIHR